MASNILQATKLELHELNRLFREIQGRINELSGAGGPSTITDNLTVEGSLRLRERGQQETVDLATDGVVWFQPREGQAQEAQLQATEKTVTADGIIRRQLDVIQRAAEDGVDVGKASTTSFNHGFDVSIDLGTDQVNVAIDEGELDHGLLSGLGDDDHPQYLKEKLSGGLASEIPLHTHADANNAGQVDHGTANDATSLLDNDHPLYQRKHGFELSTAGAELQTIAYDKTTRKVTVTPTGATFRFWIDGVQFIKTGAQVSGTAHGTTTGKYFFYYDSAGVLQTSAVETPWSIRDRTVTPVALVYWNSTLSDGVCFYECHTADRVLEIHYNLHFSRGTQFISGYDLTGYTPGTASDAAVTFAIASGVVADEDIRFTSSAVADGGPYVIFYRSGADGAWLWSATNTFPFAYGTTYPSYNQWTGATWQLTEASGSGVAQYLNYYICATTAVTPQAAQAFLIPGQTVHASLTSAQAEGLSSLSLGTLPFEEVAPLYRVTFEFKNSYAGAHKTKITQITSIKNQTVTVTGGSVGITDHGALTGLADDDHPQYVLDAGDTMTGDLTLTSATASKPVLDIINTNADATPSFIYFTKNSASPAASDAIGRLIYRGNNSTPAVHTFAGVKGVANVVTAGSEQGMLIFQASVAGTAAGDAGAASITAGTPASTAPTVHMYARPVAAKFRADTASSSIAVWDTTVFDVSNSKIALQSSSQQVAVTEAGQYRIGASVTLTLNAGVSANVQLLRYNSGAALQEQSVCVISNEHASTAKAITATFAENSSAAASDYWVVTWDAGTIVASDLYTHFSIERIN